ncbi:MAG: hypothetical protein HXY23_09360 [Parvularculaceae bacterium]|nr:hypothetical protein [Parvularculaceae bacterium]
MRFRSRAAPAAVSALLQLGFAAPASAEGLDLMRGPGAGFAGTAIVLLLMALLTGAILTSRKLDGSSLFNRLFVVVATTSGFFSAVSSAIGFQLIVGQESDDLFRNALLPPAFGVFVFFLAVAIWVGGAELVRERDWFRGMGRGLLSDMAFFLERCIKLFVVIPVLAIILFFVSTWTTVVGIAGVDAVRHTYNFEIARLQSECAKITAWRQKDFLFLEDLRLSVANAKAAARKERDSGAQSGSAGRGAVTDYIDGVADWYETLGKSVAAIIEGEDPSGVSPYDPDVCASTIDNLKRRLADDGFENYDAWAREFETGFENFAIVVNRWRQDRRIERLLDAQLAAFDRANPRPAADAEGRLSAGQRAAIERYAEDVTEALKSLLRKQRLSKPPVPEKSYAEIYPERGLDILPALLKPDPLSAPPAEARVPRTAAVVAAESIPGLSIINPRDAVIKNAKIFSDVWALGLAWDYASYILMLAYLFFPSAERAAGRKDP